MTFLFDQPGPEVPDVIRRARTIATLAHHGQTDKAGRPYIERAETVARLLGPYGDNAVAAGLLHDVVEDSDITLDQLRDAGFPAEVIDAVDSVTWRGGETYDDLVRRAAADPLGRLVKLADNATNSDPARLALLDEPTRERLAAKYRRARRILTARPARMRGASRTTPARSTSGGDQS